MTVVAVGNFKDFQILVSDSIVPLSSEKGDYAIRVKIGFLKEFDTAISLLGDEIMFNSIMHLAEWCSEKKMVLDFKNPVHLIQMLKATEISRIARDNHFKNVIPHKHSSIISVNRIDNIIWQVDAAENPKRYAITKLPVSIGLNSYGIFYAGDFV